MINLRILSLCSLLSFAACAPEEPTCKGEWASSRPIAGEYNVMFLEEDCTGAMLLRFTLDDPSVIYETLFLLECEHDSQYDLECQAQCTCEGDCSCDFLNFQMNCNETGDHDLSCNGSGVWSNYAFDWSHT